MEIEPKLNDAKSEIFEFSLFPTYYNYTTTSILCLIILIVFCRDGQNTSNLKYKIQIQNTICISFQIQIQNTASFLFFLCFVCILYVFCMFVEIQIQNTNTILTLVKNTDTKYK